MSISETASDIGERVLDILQACTPEETGAILDYVVRHHAINTELVGGDDCCLFWLAQVRAAVDAAEDKLGYYIERETGDSEEDRARDIILGRAEPTEHRRAA